MAPTRAASALAGAAIALALALAPTAPAATVTSERAGDLDRAEVCAAWETAMARSLALYGITGARAASYLALREDNPCHGTITPRSLFHAGDPGGT
jgi:hypothetical protein